MNPWQKREFWRIERGNPNAGLQRQKWGWIDNLYMGLDLNNQKVTVEKAEKLGYGKSVLGIFFKGGTKEDGTLHEYNGPYPPHIVEAGLHEVEDFRTIYKKIII
jgi:hypothetical protein